MCQEGTERLSCRALELHVDSTVRQSLGTVFLGDNSRQHRTDGAVCILDGVVQVHLFLVVDGILGSGNHLFVDNGALHSQWDSRLVNVTREVERAFLLVQQSAEIQYRRLGLHQFRVSDDVIQMLESHFGKILTNFLCEESEEIHQVFIASDEMLTQFGVLCCHTHRTGVEITFTHHHTAQYYQGSSTETKFLSA